MQSPLLGAWQCWIAFMGRFRSVSYLGRRIDHDACDSPSRFEQAVQLVLQHGTIDKRGLTYKHCCSGFAQSPMRCLYPYDENFECPSLDHLGDWFGLQVSPGMGSDKGYRFHNYYVVYKQLFSSFPPSASLLELGVAAGNSLAVWGAWFPQGAVVGLDIELLTVRQNWPLLETYGANATGNIHLSKAHRKWNTRTALQLMRQLSRIDPKGYDIIIDDGDHSSSSQIKYFEILFESALRDGGVYVIEDVSAIGKAAEYFQNLSREALETHVGYAEITFRQAEDDWNFRIASGDKRLWIEEITFRRNMVIIRKLSYVSPITKQHVLLNS